MTTQQIKENQTLYIKNLNEKLRIDDLKTTLNDVFSKFGEVVDIRARNNLKMRGQAFVTMKTIPEAKQALLTLNNQPFFGKPLIIQYAKTTSEYALLSLGELTLEKKNKKDLQRKRKRDEYYKKMKNEKENKQTEKEKEEEIKEIKKEEEVNEKPNKTLIVSGLTKEVNEKILKELFSKELEGYMGLNLFSNRGLCFIEYDNEENAKKAKNKMNNMRVGESIIKISYSK